MLLALVAAQGDLLTLDRQLSGEHPSAPARAARGQGGPVRGAIVFDRPRLACVQRNVGEGGRPPIGPDPARMGKDVIDACQIESTSDPSKAVKKGYETVAIATVAGEVRTGRPDVGAGLDGSSEPAVPDPRRTADPAGRSGQAAEIL